MSDLKKKIVVLDGQGGGMGLRIAEAILEKHIDATVYVVGTNSMATANMMRAGAVKGATGENAWIYNCGNADLIVGPMGVIFANSLNGEVSPRMASAVTESEAQLILFPVNKHQGQLSIVGLPALTFQESLKAFDECLESHLK